MKPGMVVHTYNPSIGEAETGGLRVPGQIGLQSKILSQKKKKKNVQDQLVMAGRIMVPKREKREILTRVKTSSRQGQR
jgi:hypothetical protein